MPRLTKTHAEAQQEAVVKALDVYFCERKRAGVDHNSIAKPFGICYTTLRHKMQRPGSFRLDELQRIANVLNISISRLLGEEQA